VSEAEGEVTLTIVQNAPSIHDSKVEYSTSDDTATSLDDYGPTAGVATIAAGLLATTVAIPIVNDDLDELDETLILALSNPVRAVISPFEPGFPISAGLRFRGQAKRDGDIRRWSFDGGQSVVSPTEDAIPVVSHPSCAF
jgi:hypothetical protein